MNNVTNNPPINNTGIPGNQGSPANPPKDNELDTRVGNVGKKGLDQGSEVTKDLTGKKVKRDPQTGDSTTAKAEKLHLKTFIHQIATRTDGSIRDVPSHGEFERRLWIANAFVIPLVVYPIITVLGHLIIEILRDCNAEMYRDIESYLDGERTIRKTDKAEEMRLSSVELNNIRQIYTDWNYSDEAFKKSSDPVYQKLRQKINREYYY